ncbi:MAG: hypothetical protein J5517_07415 [Eubacterium sp.]|nr:hypothetical protein [Eubacterium sp.]
MDKELMDILEGKDEKTAEAEKKEFKEITLKFGKGLVGDEFQGKDGNSYRQIMIPPNEETKQPWQTFVVKSNQVHENQFGKGMWCKLPAEGSTTVTKSVAKGVDEQGKTIWENEKRKVPNTELKSMVEAYKNKDKSQETEQTLDKGQSKESTQAKTNDEVKDKSQEKGSSLMEKIEKKSMQAASKDKSKKEAEKGAEKDAKTPKAPKKKKEQTL